MPTAQQCVGGAPTAGATGQQGNKQTGGGLSMPKVPGFSATSDQAAAFEFADGVFAPSKPIEAKWVAVYALGGLPRANGFDSPQQAAQTVYACMIGSEKFYNNVTGSSVTAEGATTVDGADAYVLDGEIRNSDPDVTVPGDVVKIVVVDTGDPDHYGLLVSVVPIGDQALIDQQQAQQGLITIG